MTSKCCVGLITFALLLAGCGGGGSSAQSDSPITNAAPVANAGPAQNVVSGATVTLDGSASTDANNDPLTYSWSLTAKPTGSMASIDSSTSVKPTFIADSAGTYVASLIVNDSKISSAAATVTVTALAPAERVLKVVFVGCKLNDVPGLSMVNDSKVQGLEWTSDRITSWVNDLSTGFKSYLETELLKESGIGNYVEVRDWRDIGSSKDYATGIGFDIGKMRTDCLNAHSVSQIDFDIIGMFFNVELGASYGGGGNLYLSKWVSPTVIVHELLHAMNNRLGLKYLLHSNMTNVELVPPSIEVANTFSIMYGNGQYISRDGRDDTEFGTSPGPLTTANRWMAGALQGASICSAGYGVSTFTFRAWGEPGPSCLLLKVDQKDGKTITIELQPTGSSFQTRKLDFLDGIPVGSRFLVGVKYPTPVSPNATDWAAISSADYTGDGWVYEGILFNSGQVLNVGNATITFLVRSVVVNVTNSP